MIRFLAHSISLKESFLFQFGNVFDKQRDLFIQQLHFQQSILCTAELRVKCDFRKSKPEILYFLDLVRELLARLQIRFYLFHLRHRSQIVENDSIAHTPRHLNGNVTLSHFSALHMIAI